MEDRFFTKAQFNDNFGKEMVSANTVYERRSASGLNDYSLAIYDFVFISDTRDKLTKLKDFLHTNYDYKVNEIKDYNKYWELTGDATEFPVDEHNLMYWALDLYCKGYEFDCKLDGYGAIGDPENQKFPEMEADKANYYFDLAMEAYNRRNLGMSIIHFSTAIKIKPNDPNSWYSRAFMKDELHTWKAARRDYDKAIELAPDFIDAIINRAANKDEAGEYDEAIADYNKAIALEPQNEMAYFNRGNSKHNKKDNKGACEDWSKAKELGAEYAQQRIDEHCKSFKFSMKSITSLIILLFLTTLTFAQSKVFKAKPAQAAALKKQAEACADAMQKQNYKQMAYYTYPPIVKAMGGADKIAEKITASMTQMQSQGISFKSVAIGNIGDIIKSKGDLYSVVPDIIQLSANGTVVTRGMFVLAISHNNGLRWYFVDTAPFKKQNIKKLFPTYPDGLVIPEVSKPVY